MNDLTYFRDSRVLITGGAGMIGSTIARLLVEQRAEVTIVDAMLPTYGGNRFNLNGIFDKIVFIKDDIRNLDRVKRWVDGADYVFSLAAQVSYVDSNHDPLLDLDINCRGHLNLLLALSQINRRAKVVFTSSRFVYGSIDYNPVDEGHDFNCLSIYGIHKLAGEKYHQLYHHLYNLPTTVLRLSNPYGPSPLNHQTRYNIVNHFIRQALRGNPLQVFGDGQQVRDYPYIGDVVDAFLLAGSHPEAVGRAFNVGSGQPIPFIEMARTIIEVVGSGGIEPAPWPDEYQQVETGDFYFDIGPVRQRLGWQPRTDLATGIRLSVDRLRAMMAPAGA
jgi:UDP-glucose 4-epimerase